MKSKMFNSSVLTMGFAPKHNFRDFSLLSSIQFNCRADYSNAEKKVLECANYLISNPLDRKNLNRGYAESFLALWISGTPDFSFNIDKTACKIVKCNLSLLSIYLAFAVKYMLENRDKVNDENDIYKYVFSMVIGYCNNPQNKVELNDSLKELLNEKCKVA